jgi:hypothetical protein
MLSVTRPIPDSSAANVDEIEDVLANVRLNRTINAEPIRPSRYVWFASGNDDD